MLNFISINKVFLLSAASSLVNGRHDTKYHAVFPLRGKPLSTCDRSVEQALENKEINAIFKLLNLGTSEGNVFEECKTFEEAEAVFQQYSNYGKVIISTDAKQIHLIGVFKLCERKKKRCLCKNRLTVKRKNTQYRAKLYNNIKKV